jgi:ABC-type multidrug transport system fused ATPase/permease subunit
MPQFIISTIGGIIYNTVIVLGPILLGNLIDAAGGGNGRKVILSALYFAGVTAFFQFARVVKRWFMRDQFNRVTCDLRQTFMEKTLGRKLPELEKESVGDLMSRTVGDITMVVDTVMTTLNEGWDTWLLMISYFAALLIKDWKITLIASIMVPLTILLAQNMRHALFKYSMAARKAAAASNSGLQRYLDAAAVLRLFGREASEADGIRKAFEEQAGYNIKETLLQQALLPVYSLIAGLGIVVAIALGGSKVVTGAWTVGSFNAFLVMFIAFSGRTRVAARVFNQWHAAKAAWKRIKEKMKDSNPLTTYIDTKKQDCQTLNVENLSFGFSNGDILHNISFNAKKGQIIGITGAVGSGKTAMAHALTGLYPYKGRITLDEKELSKLSTDDRKNLIAYAGHQQFLFSMSIKDNIIFSDEACDEVLFEKTLYASALKDDIARFDNGLETQVGEKGARVSGGQKQRIAMARAIYAKTPILLLDDPFSAVDIATESKIIDHLKKNYEDKIVILFTHRLTAFKYADQIMVLEKGGIIQQGTHDELIHKNGLYKDIYDAQMFMEVGANA